MIRVCNERMGWRERQKEMDEGQEGGACGGGG